MHDDTRKQIEAYAERVVANGDAVPTMRRTGRMKHTAKEGHVVGDITVEITGPLTLLPPSGFIEEALLATFAETRDACRRVNGVDLDGDVPF